MVGASVSYHKGVELLNRLLHRDPDNTIKFCTYRDFCERSGKQIEDSIAQKARDILNAHHFDAESGKPTELLASELTESAQPYQDDAAIHCAIEKVNAARPAPDEQVKDVSWQIEDSKQTCYLSFDDIGVKHQKEHRVGSAEKKGEYVWNTVADIETNQGSHTVTVVGMKKTFLFTLSYLLQHKLLAGKSVVFFTDGAAPK